MMNPESRLSGGTMFETAVIASTGADSHALHDEVSHLWSLGVREVVLTHCVDVFDDATDSWRTQGDAEDAFTERMSAFESRHMRVHAEVPLGRPAMSLREVSREHAAELIVVGIGDTSLFGSGLPDDRTADIIALSETPVLLRPRQPHRAGPIAARILFATDFSQAADRAFSALLGVVKSCRGRVDILHVQEPASLAYGVASESVEFDRTCAVRLSRLKEQLLAEGSEEVTTRVISGEPVDELTSWANSGRYNLIVMGSRGRSGQSNGILGDVSGPFVRVSGVPILLVPPARARTNTSSAVRV